MSRGMIEKCQKCGELHIINTPCFQCEPVKYRPNLSGTPMRKVVQINVIHYGDRYINVYALCNDGSMWESHEVDDGGVAWKRLPDIPQDEVKNV